MGAVQVGAVGGCGAAAGAGGDGFGIGREAPRCRTASADRRSGGGSLRRVRTYFVFLPRDLLPSPSRQRRDGRLWCWNVEDAEEVTADNVSLITVSCLVEVQVGS